MFMFPPDGSDINTSVDQRTETKCLFRAFNRRLVLSFIVDILLAQIAGRQPLSSEISRDNHQLWNSFLGLSTSEGSFKSETNADTYYKILKGQRQRFCVCDDFGHDGGV
jgi:hypothetical protein